MYNVEFELNWSSLNKRALKDGIIILMSMYVENKKNCMRLYTVILILTQDKLIKTRNLTIVSYMSYFMRMKMSRIKVTLQTKEI